MNIVQALEKSHYITNDSVNGVLLLHENDMIESVSRLYFSERDGEIRLLTSHYDLCLRDLTRLDWRPVEVNISINELT